MQNAFGQDITGFPFDKAHKFASEERIVMDKLMGVQSGVIKGVMDDGVVTAKALVATVGRVLIYAKGAWFKINQSLDIPIQPGSTGTIVARIDLSQVNSSVGAIDDGSYNYLLNQTSFQAVTTAPIKEDILNGGVIYDVILYTYTATTTTVTLTDAREYSKAYNASGTLLPIGEMHSQFDGHRINQTQPVTNGNKPAAFSDGGASSIDALYANCIYQGKITNDAFIIYDNGGIDAKNNTGMDMIVIGNGYSDCAIASGTTEMSGNVRTLIRRITTPGGSWGDWLTGLDSRIGASRYVYNWSPMRPHIFCIQPGQAMGLTVTGRMNSLPSGSAYNVSVNFQSRAYLTQKYKGKTGKF